MMWRAVVKWIIAGCLGAGGLGCAASHEGLATRPQRGRVDSFEVGRQLDDRLDRANRALKGGDLAAASTFIKQAFEIDPTSQAAETLQERLRQAQRRAEENARRELSVVYQREGLTILRGGDVDRALAYLQAAHELDPANRKAVKLIQQAYAIQHQLVDRQRAEAFVQAPVEPSSPVERSPETAAAPGEYTIQPEDVLHITVYEEPDLTTRARVSSSGEIAFPLLGRVAVSGLAVPQVQEKLTRLLGEDYLVNPQVQVFIEAYHARNVFVTGSVNKPGSYPLPSERLTTLLEAVAMAGGFSDEAAVNGTRIIRIEDGKEKTITVRVNDIIKKGDKTKDAAVQPNDLIFVPESFF